MKKLRMFLAALGLVLTASPALAGHEAGQLPPTIPIPDQFDGFTIKMTSQDVACVGNQHTSECENSPIVPLWDAKYQFDVPYTSVSAGWWGGDREAYACSYMLLQVNGNIIGDVIFASVKPPQHTLSGMYGVIKDDQMPEGGNGGRYLSNGALIPSNLQHAEPGECPGTSVPYESDPTAHVEPRIAFFRGSHLVEIRDYRPTGDVIPEGHVFNVVEHITTPFQVTVPSGTFTVNQRVTVVEYDESGVPQIVVYYDSRGTGHLGLDFPS